VIFQILTIGLLVLFFINLLLNLKKLTVLRSGNGWPDPPPLVSVLIPSRDEAGNIGTCLASLQRQNYPNFEVIVLDDNSTDDTATIIAGLAAIDQRIRLVAGRPLAEGWAGKPYACFQAAQEARGEWLLFVDADTRHQPEMLSHVMARALQERPGLLSGFPRQDMPGFWQVVVLPLMYFLVLSWAPLWLLQHSRRPRPQVAIGQFLLFQAAAYWSFNGHTAVKNRIIDDVWLGVMVTRHGWRHLSVDLSALVECRMYDSLGNMWEGLVKWMYSVAALSMPALTGLIILGSFSFLVPFISLWRGAVIGAAWYWVAVMQIALILIMRYLVDARFRLSAVSFFLHPLGMATWILAALWGMGRRLAGAGVSWKNRLYCRSSSVE
jgi:chlorobactene glucosyltransferase